jgi:hypothetical protein
MAESFRVVGGCRPVAEVRKLESENRFEITFYRSLSETVSGIENCDFAFSPIRVNKAEVLGGKALTFIDRNGIPIYTTDDSIDLTKPALSFEWNGHSYISDQESIEQRERVVRIQMRRFPPK